MATWQKLDEELARWQQAGRMATLWWRDDDASILTPQLKQLVEIADAAEIPLHLAVIPARLEADAAQYLRASPNTRILQHGYAHMDHAPKGQGSWELGDHRPLDVVINELRLGHEILADAFGVKFLPVLVPPWTRFSEKLRPYLSEIGFKAYSAEGLRDAGQHLAGLKTIHAHCDPIKWKQNARFKGCDRVEDDIVEHLQMRRTGKCDPSEPTGLCTHHMDHQADLWQFLADFTAHTAAHPAVRWIALEEELA